MGLSRLILPSAFMTAFALNLLTGTSTLRADGGQSGGNFEVCSSSPNPTGSPSSSPDTTSAPNEAIVNPLRLSCREHGHSGKYECVRVDAEGRVVQNFSDE